MLPETWFVGISELTMLSGISVTYDVEMAKE